MRALANRRVRWAGLEISMKRMLSELDDIREMVNVYPRKRRQKVKRQQTLLTKTSEIQQKLISIFEREKEPNSVSG